LLTFDGTLLATITSERDSSPRWTEMSVYKTDQGTYILEKVGKSTVTHLPGCKDIIGKLPRFQEAHPGADPDNFEYHSCVTEEYDFTELLCEEDRYWSTIASDPAKIVDALYRKRAGERHMPRISLDLLTAASEADPALAAVAAIERID
jgi:hypothetical protein